MSIKKIIEAQRDYFHSGETLSSAFRKNKLKMLLKKVEEKEDKIYQSLYHDLNKSEYEAYLTEISLVKNEIKLMIKNLDRWTSLKKIKSSLSTMPNKSYVIREPYGVVLIISPWNYPFQLSMIPLIGAVAAGNTIILKTSRNSAHTSEIIREIIKEVFPPHYVYVTEKEYSHDQVICEKYDYIFFTGSQRVGKIIMREAADHLTPLTLELGGKSPVIVDETADLKDASKKIIWGKCINSGQTCVAPDYILVHESIKEKLIEEMKEEIKRNYSNCENSEEYPKIINRRKYMKLCRLIEKESNVIGGSKNEEAMKIAPTIFPDASFQSESMKEEIFGPLLPVISYYHLETVIEQLKEREKSLALYIFSNNKRNIEKIISEVSYGGGCINDCIMHLANENLPFGGVGSSGMGKYHGEYSIKTFTNEKAILVNKGKYDIPLRFRPFTEKKLKSLKRLIER